MSVYEFLRPHFEKWAKENCLDDDGFPLNFTVDVFDTDFYYRDDNLEAAWQAYIAGYKRNEREQHET